MSDACAKHVRLTLLICRLACCERSQAVPARTLPSTNQSQHFTERPHYKHITSTMIGSVQLRLSANPRRQVSCRRRSPSSQGPRVRTAQILRDTETAVQPQPLPDGARQGAGSLEVRTTWRTLSLLGDIELLSQRGHHCSLTCLAYCWVILTSTTAPVPLPSHPPITVFG